MVVTRTVQRLWRSIFQPAMQRRQLLLATQAAQFTDAGLPGGQVLTHCKQQRGAQRRGGAWSAAAALNLPAPCHMPGACIHLLRRRLYQAAVTALTRLVVGSRAILNFAMACPYCGHG